MIAKIIYKDGKLIKRSLNKEEVKYGSVISASPIFQNLQVIMQSAFSSAAENPAKVCQIYNVNLNKKC